MTIPVVIVCRNCGNESEDMQDIPGMILPSDSKLLQFIDHCPNDTATEEGGTPEPKTTN